MFMHDGAPAHFSTEVRDRLNNIYPLRGIGQGGPVAWPPISPDLKLLDFFLWGLPRNLVFKI